jgi:sugar transferase (PEP-CTERM/EpsH1 system associated)
LNLLVLTPQLPWPLHQGTAIRNFNILRRLAGRHDITLLTFADPGADLGPLEGLGLRVVTVPPPRRRSLARRGWELGTTATPDLARRLTSAVMHARVSELLAEHGDRAPFRVVQVEGLEVAAYGLAAQAAAGHAGRPVRLVYDAHNAEWVLQWRAFQADLRRIAGWPGAGYSLLQTWKLRRFERDLLTRADATVAVSRADAAALGACAPGARPTIVPNGVDVRDYRPADPDAVEPALCVFTGKMDFRPNIDAVAWFADAVWPLVRAQRPEAHWAIVGRDPVERVRALDRPDHGVRITGAVEDVRPWLERAGVVVVPLRVGGGTRLKVLEAMAMAKAIAATRLAVEGLDLTGGVEALLADAPEDLAAGIVQLMADPARRASLGRAARERAVADFDWDRLVPRIEALYHP